ncbi:esterase [Ideonella sp. 4Y16]|uniref:Esterase n=1 Tax=Ideonella alba TaxID=2824118 RepID=A0A941BEI7_9BURK|nr:SGNH/GDSL hydrolase family protein [Ideonella alba]MBQ0930017.1 esterase [Ideonella alba]MBQ0946077.1 esterase [Ideonella alba]
MTASSLAARLARAAGVALIGATLLAACGGGTSQVDRFVPARVLSFGDELSRLEDNGTKYSVNALTTTTPKTIDCGTSPIWTQYMASTAYAKVFTQCKGTATSPDVTAIRLGTVGARVDDVVALMKARIDAGDVQNTDLVTVMVGMHDIIDQYALYDGTNEADLIATLTAQGKKLAAQINTVTGTGARVLVSTIHDLGLSPWALKEKADVGDDRPALLTRLVNAFNKAMRLDLINDGSKIGLMLGDDLSRAMVRVPSAYGLGDVITPACLEANWNSASCTTDTLITAAKDKSASYLWADQVRPSSTFHLYLGQQAVSRLGNLPF